MNNIQLLVIANACKNNTSANGLMPDVWMVKTEAVAGFYKTAAKILGKLCRTTMLKNDKIPTKITEPRVL